MPLARNFDLHGNLPDSAPTALLVLDVLSDFEFPGGTKLLRQVEVMAPRLAKLKAGLRKKKIPVIYANDNAGKWRSSREAILQNALSPRSRGRRVAELLKPDDEDYFVIKPKHSAFYGTGLELVLQYLNVQNLVIAGMAGDSCVYFTAADAYLRDYRVHLATDCIVSIDPQENRDAIRRMGRLLKTEKGSGAALLRKRALFTSPKA